MRLIKDIRDGQLDRPKVRETTRLVLIDSSGLVPLLHFSKDNFHALSGGGIESGESWTDSAKREALEETGCEIEITDELGMIIEYRVKWNLKQVSYGYVGKASRVGEPKFTKGERREGCRLVWFTMDEAIAALTQDMASTYEAPFIRERDLIFLEEARTKLFKL